MARNRAKEEYPLMTALVELLTHSENGFYCGNNTDLELQNAENVLKNMLFGRVLEYINSDLTEGCPEGFEPVDLVLRAAEVISEDYK